MLVMAVAVVSEPTRLGESRLVHGSHMSFWLKKGEVPPVISRLASPINSGISNPDPVGLS